MKKLFLLTALAVFVSGTFFSYSLPTNASVLLAATKSPTECGTISIPNITDGSWINCGNGFSSNNRYTFTGGGDATFTMGYWSGYGFNPAIADIQSVVLRVEAALENDTDLIVVVTTDEGSNYYPIWGGNNGVETTYTFDLTNDFNWTGTSLSDENLSVELWCYDSPSVSGCAVDSLPIEVRYMAIAEE